MNDVVVIVERNRRNNLTTNFLRDQIPVLVQISAQICSGNLHPTENAFFRRGKGLEELTGIGIGLKQRTGLRD